MEINKIYNESCINTINNMPNDFINMVITSPPYWGLRDYSDKTKTIWNDWEGQLGLEPKFSMYVNHLIYIFNKIKPKIKNDGTLWVNLGDSYAGNMGKKMGWTDNKLGFTKQKAIEKGVCLTKKTKIIHELPRKCLVGIPFRFATKMLENGWILRNTIIWHKNNCMPSSAKDRFTIDFEYIFFFVKNKKYFFNQQFEPFISNDKTYKAKNTKQGIYAVSNNRNRAGGNMSKGRNKRCVWNINTKPFKEAHFATYPEKLLITPIKAGCPKNGIVYDPFMGSGTTAIVAKKLNRKFIGSEINPEYIEIAVKRIKNTNTQLELL